MEKVREGMDPKYLDLIRLLPCIVTGRRGPSDPHHLMRVDATARGMSLTTTDRWALPFCRDEHDKVQRAGVGEEAHLAALGIDGRGLATTLWETRGKGLDAMYRIVWNSLQKRGIHIEYDPPEIIMKRTRYV
jgi:hypothetical protein